jgi:TRAP transporter TAXI family solute receptor
VKKKGILSGLISFLTVAVIVAGCGSGNNQQTGGTPAPKENTSTSGGTKEAPAQPSGSDKKVTISIATAPDGGAYYVIGQALASVINKHSTKAEAKVQATEGSAHNIRLMQSGEAQMAIVSADAINDVIKGQNTFKDKQWDGFSAIVSGHVGEWHMGVPADSGVNSVADLKGKVVAWRLQGSPTVDAVGRVVFNAYGIDPEKDIETQISSPYPDAAQRMKDGRVDAVGTLTGYPTPWVTEFIASKPLKLLSLDQDKIDSILKDYPFFVQSKIPAGTYTGIDYDVDTIANITMLMISKDIPEDVAYDITKVLFEHGEEALSIAKQVAPYFSKDNALKVQGVADYNPGSIKYYKEIGIWKE